MHAVGQSLGPSQDLTYWGHWWCQYKLIHGLLDWFTMLVSWILAHLHIAVVAWACVQGNSVEVLCFPRTIHWGTGYLWRVHAWIGFHGVVQNHVKSLSLLVLESNWSWPVARVCTLQVTFVELIRLQQSLVQFFLLELGLLSRWNHEIVGLKVQRNRCKVRLSVFIPTCHFLKATALCNSL